MEVLTSIGLLFAVCTVVALTAWGINQVEKYDKERQLNPEWHKFRGLDQIQEKSEPGKVVSLDTARLNKVLREVLKNER